MILEFLFPSLCPHCKGGKPSKTLLCSTCSQDIDFHQERTKFPPSLLNNIDYALPFDGANITLYRLYVHKKHLSLTSGFTSLLSLKLHNLKWPKFDLIMTPTIPAFHRIRHGYHPDVLLCKTLARQLKINTTIEKSLLKQNVLIITTKLDVKVVQETALKLSPYLPRSVYSLSLFGEA